MSDIDLALNAAANIKGAFAVALVDYDSGMTLGSRGGSVEFDLDVAAPGNSEVVRTKLEVMEKLGLREVGYAPRFLHIDGDWRDHRIFAVTVEECAGSLVDRLQRPHQSHE